jgi:hypothetical protein
VDTTVQPHPPPNEQRPPKGAPSAGLDQSLEPKAEDTVTAQVLAGIHGGERRAAHWLRRVLEAVAP